MTREVVLKFLEAQLKKLKEEHVSDLMKANRVEELEEIVDELEFDTLEEFCDENESLKLEICEIPEDFHYELAFYISQSGCEDREIFEDYDDFRELLKETQEELAETIADTMERYDLRWCSIEELLAGVPTEDDEEDE